LHRDGTVLSCVKYSSAIGFLNTILPEEAKQETKRKRHIPEDITLHNYKRFATTSPKIDVKRHEALVPCFRFKYAFVTLHTWLPSTKYATHFPQDTEGLSITHAYIRLVVVGLRGRPDLRRLVILALISFYSYYGAGNFLVMLNCKL
jgi:hypothetical protein